MKVSNGLDELKRMHDRYILRMIGVSNATKKSIRPMIIFSINGNVSASVLSGDERVLIKTAIDSISDKPLDWVVILNEAYLGTENMEYLQNYKQGTMEQRFKDGDKAVREVVLLQIYTRTEKYSATYDKLDCKLIRSGSEFTGFLTVSDVARIRWADWLGLDEKRNPVYGDDK